MRKDPGNDQKTHGHVLVPVFIDAQELTELAADLDGVQDADADNDDADDDAASAG